MEIKKLSELSIPASGCGDIALSFDGLTLVCRYEFRRDRRDFIGAITFVNTRAFRFRDELLSADYASEAYNSLVEMRASPWLRELEQTGAVGVTLSSVAHYAVLLSSNGYLEVVSEGHEIGVAVEGRLHAE
jgi:hypothetical protein